MVNVIVFNPFGMHVYATFSPHFKHLRTFAVPFRQIEKNKTEKPNFKKIYFHSVFIYLFTAYCLLGAKTSSLSNSGISSYWFQLKRQNHNIFCFNSNMLTIELCSDNIS